MECLLPESLDISTVLDTTTQYQEWLANQDTIHLDATAVVRVDAAGIQLLSSLFISAKKNQREIQLLKPSEVLLEGIETLGLQDVFDLKLKSESNQND
ncbi:MULTISPECIES: STAS domain-containing protein [Vibrio]|uniref:STAS domain-containing protein n=1 Tax=Vibrio neptunius TaxID=170651 RepID=A0ABS2ZZQ0_9VIBR|nr:MULTISPECIES: STAS domain-containing protein [Vibrio]KJY86849.1 anti-anti-sigma regulatory factor [Vibrio neptunius]MBN3492935.1 STAS domain-containing protein [Vibrio neptunius]MBN3515347.1 STAS domain-containing protein [Vibrio neptunius]MBN3549467.1 STAS domain-containing protein [Vibrio neptunius]MBN3573729.1 STAS domain-containing protein [Vibrio neptunius]